MNKNQKVVFWSMFIGFCVVATIGIYPQGAFNYTGSMGGSLILLGFYFLVAFMIYLFVLKNPKEIDKWFNK